MSLLQSYGPPVLQTSLSAMLLKNWGSSAKPGGFTVENQAVTAGTAYNVLNVSGKGPGCVTSMWMTCAAPTSGSTQNTLNGLIQIFVDGEATPSVSFDLGGPLGWYQSSTTVGIKTFTRSFMTETQPGASQFVTPTCHNIFLPIPYQSSIIINFIPTQTSANFFFNARYVSLPTHLPFKLLSQCTTFDNSIGSYGAAQWVTAQLGNGSVKLLNLAGGSGYIAYAWLYFLSSAANLNTLACDVNVYLNGKTPGTGYLSASPDLSASGIDSFFRYSAAAGGASAAIPTSIPQAAITNATVASGTFHGSLDIANADGCWRFTSGAVIQLESGQGGTGGNSASIGSGVLYYADIP